MNTKSIAAVIAHMARGLGLAATLALTAAGASAQAPAQRAGTVVVTDRAGVKIHSYVAPANGWLVNSQIVEGPTKLVIFDSQLANPYAEEVAAYAESLHKPIERIVVSHGHPDHWDGLEVLNKHFPDAPIYALAGTAAAMKAKGDWILKNIVQKNLGALAPSRVVQPTRILAPGSTVIDGVAYDFREYTDAESEDQLVALMPKQHVLLAFDTVFAPNDFAFTVAPFFDHWISVLQSLKTIKGYDRIIIGHDAPTDAKAIDTTIEYVKAAGSAYAASPDAATYIQKMKAAFPNRQQAGWLEFSATLLYSTPKK